MARHAQKFLGRCSAEVGHGLDARGTIESDLVIIGAGLAGTLDHSTLPAHRVSHVPLPFALPPRFRVLCVSGASEPWVRWGSQRAGQHASEWASPGFILQPNEFVDGEHTGYSNAAALGDAIAVTAMASGMIVLRDWIAGPLTIEAGAVQMRGRTRASGESRVYRASHVDITVGLGPERWLADDDRRISRDTEGELRRRGQVLTGTEYLEEHRQHRDRAVLVVGGGPTAAWCAERAAAQGVTRIHWVATLAPPSAGGRTRRERECAHQLRVSELRLKARRNPPNVRRRLEKAIRDLSGFWSSMRTRNHPGFRHPKIHRAIARVAALEPSTDGGVRVSFDGLPDCTYDRVVVCIGHEPMASAGPVGLARGLHLRPVLAKVAGGERLVALESVGRASGCVRVLGAAMYIRAFSRLIPSRHRQRFESLIGAQSERSSTSHDSAWVFGSVLQAATDIPLANATPGGASPQPSAPFHLQQVHR